MDMIYKTAHLGAASVDEHALELINMRTLRKLSADDVFVFRLAACDNLVDRDGERFTEATLEQLSGLYVGKPVLRDHTWSAAMQTARVYDARVVGEGRVKRLVLDCYMVRSAGTADTIAAIEGGILSECSVGCSVQHVNCSICGADQRDTLCKHVAGREYDGQRCHFELDGAADAYEVSLVAVPAQPEAGVVKAKRYGGTEGKEPHAPGGADDKERWADEAALELEKMRF